MDNLNNLEALIADWHQQAVGGQITYQELESRLRQIGEQLNTKFATDGDFDAYKAQYALLKLVDATGETWQLSFDGQWERQTAEGERAAGQPVLEAVVPPAPPPPIGSVTEVDEGATVETPPPPSPDVARVGSPPRGDGPSPEAPRSKLFVWGGIVGLVVLGVVVVGIVLLFSDGSGPVETTPAPTDELVVADNPTVEPTIQIITEAVPEATQESSDPPTAEPTAEITTNPTQEATQEASTSPTNETIIEPSTEPTQESTIEPTIEPPTEPTVESSASEGEATPYGTIAYAAFDSSIDNFKLYFRTWPDLNIVEVIERAGQPAILPSQDRLAYRSWDGARQGLVKRHLNSPDELDFIDQLDAMQPAWSPTGKLAYSLFIPDQQKWRIVVDGQEINIDGSLESPAWLNDNQLVFRSCLVDGCGIATANVDGSDFRWLTKGEDYNPAPSPNGQQIVFMSSRQSNWDIYTIPITGSPEAAPTRLTTSPTFDIRPTWSPDGRWIVFLSNANNQWAMWLMPAVSGDTQLLFDLEGEADGFLVDGTAQQDALLQEQISWYSNP